MNSALLIHTPVFSGGMHVILQHAVRKNITGGRCYVVAEKRYSARDFPWFPRADEVHFRSFKELGAERLDLAISTWWETALQLHRVRAERYASFVQVDESRYYPPAHGAKACFARGTYSLPVSFITEAKWLRKYLHGYSGLPCLLAPNGVDKNLFRENGLVLAERSPTRLRFLVEGTLEQPFKGVEPALLACRSVVGAEVWLLTLSDLTRHPLADRTFSRLPPDQLGPIYRSCDVLVKMSAVEGLASVPLEFFHCGGTAVSWATTGHEDYMRHMYNALLCPVGDDIAVQAALLRLANDRTLLEVLRKGALATARSWPDWEQASAQFWELLEGAEAGAERKGLKVLSFDLCRAYAQALRRERPMMALPGMYSLARWLDHNPAWAARLAALRKGLAFRPIGS